jgi:hypothetical protein
MTLKVRLSEIVDALDEATDEAAHSLDRKTGQVLYLPDEFARLDDDLDEEVPEWRQGFQEDARLVRDQPDRFLELPDQAGLDEPRIIRAFCASLPDGPARARLEEAFRGRGAFRRFKDALFDLDLEQSWYAFRHEALVELAIEWCEENDVRWVADED